MLALLFSAFLINKVVRLQKSKATSGKNRFLFEISRHNFGKMRDYFRYSTAANGHARS